MAKLLKHTPSKIASNAGLGNTPEPTVYQMKVGSKETFLQWANSGENSPPKRRARRPVKIVTTDTNDLSE